jgi:cyclopropane-fatty-acyl-phospholipid synthase
MVMHAAAHYGVRALGVTISRHQAQGAQRRIAEAGLTRRAEVRLLDYRDVNDQAFDAVASIGAMEHFGTSQLGHYFAVMASRLQPGGRMLNHCITRPSTREPRHAGPFMDRYIFPTASCRDRRRSWRRCTTTASRSATPRTCASTTPSPSARWSANLEAHWPDAVAEVGERRARAWRLYLAVSRLAFELGRVQIHQVLGARQARDGRARMPLRPDWEHPRRVAELAPRAAIFVPRALVTAAPVRSPTESWISVA